MKEGIKFLTQTEITCILLAFYRAMNIRNVAKDKTKLIYKEGKNTIMKAKIVDGTPTSIFGYDDKHLIEIDFNSKNRTITVTKENL